MPRKTILPAIPLLATTTALAAFVSTSVAFAAPCDSLVDRADKATGAALVEAYGKVAACDVQAAKDAFPRFMLRSGDLETLVPITLKAIDLGAAPLVGKMMEKVPYAVQTDLAEAVGAACADQASVVDFLQTSARELRGTAFTRWAPAHAACAAPVHVQWLESVTAKPPSSPYSDKYAAVVGALVSQRGVDAMPVLEQAAIAAAEGGPFGTLVEQIAAAAKPAKYGDPVDPAAEKAMRETYVRVAKASPSDAARKVADKLYTLGAEAEAASLLPAIFPDAVQSDGTLLWAAAAVESCEGLAVIHWAGVTQPPNVWGVVDVVSAPLRASSQRVKCDAGEWPVLASDEPLANGDQVEAWVGLLQKEWEAKGLEVKLRHEKKLAL